MDFYLNIRADQRRLFALSDMPLSLGYSSLANLVFAVLASGSDDAGKNFMVKKKKRRREGREILKQKSFLKSIHAVCRGSKRLK